MTSAPQEEREGASLNGEESECLTISSNAEISAQVKKLYQNIIII